MDEYLYFTWWELVFESRLILDLVLIGLETGAGFLNQSFSVVMENQSKRKLFSTPKWKPLCCVVVVSNQPSPLTLLSYFRDRARPGNPDYLEPSRARQGTSLVRYSGTNQSYHTHDTSSNLMKLDVTPIQFNSQSNPSRKWCRYYANSIRFKGIGYLIRHYIILVCVALECLRKQEEIKAVNKRFAHSCHVVFSWSEMDARSGEKVKNQVRSPILAWPLNKYKF